MSSQKARKFMAQTGKRRSERVILDVPLVICGETPDKRTFREETFSVTVSAHGALIMLEAKVALGQKLMLMNPKNWDERESRVAFVGPDRAGLAQVGVEFVKPSPEFWDLTSPPRDWRSA
jgi:hypothetical protein